MKIGSIYVEVRGDTTQYQKDMRQLRSDAKASGTEISNALNNALSPTQAARGISQLSQNLTQLSNVAKTPAASFKTTSQSISKDLGDLAKKTGMSEKEFAKLNERMMKNTAAKNAERSLKQLASSAGLSEKEAKKLAVQMGFTEKEAARMAKGIKSAESGINKLAMAKKAATIAATALVAGMGAAVYGMKKAVDAANVQEEAEAKLGATLKATGHAAGFNLEQLKTMAAGMQQASTAGDELILNGMGILATFKEVRGEAFEGATQAALDMSAVMGQDLKSSIVQIGKALNDPIQGLSALSRVGVSFTEQQKEQIKALQESGDIMGAQKIILQELESEFGGAAAAMADTFGGKLQQVKNTFSDLQEEIGYTITKSDAFKGALDGTNVLLQDMISWVKDNREELAQIFIKGLDGARAFGTFLDGLIITMKDMGIIQDTIDEKRSARITQLQKEIIIHTEIAQNEKATGEVRLHHAALLAQKQTEYARLMQKSRGEVEKNGKAEKVAGAIAVQSAESRIVANKKATVAIKTMWEEFEDGNKAISAVDSDLKKFFGDLDQQTVDATKNIKTMWEEFEASQKSISAVDADLKTFFADYDRETDEAKGKTDEMSKYMEDRYNEAFDGMQDVLAEWIKTGEFSFDSVLDMFKNMLAEMVAAWIMNMAKMEIASWFSDSGSGWAGTIASLFNGGSGGGGGGGGGSLVNAGTSAASLAYQAYTGESMATTVYNGVADYFAGQQTVEYGTTYSQYLAGTETAALTAQQYAELQALSEGLEAYYVAETGTVAAEGATTGGFASGMGTAITYTGYAAAAALVVAALYNFFKSPEDSRTEWMSNENIRPENLNSMHGRGWQPIFDPYSGGAALARYNAFTQELEIITDKAKLQQENYIKSMSNNWGDPLSSNQSDFRNQGGLISKWDEQQQIWTDVRTPAFFSDMNLFLASVQGVDTSNLDEYRRFLEEDLQIDTTYFNSMVDYNHILMGGVASVSDLTTVMDSMGVSSLDVRDTLELAQRAAAGFDKDLVNLEQSLKNQGFTAQEMAPLMDMVTMSMNNLNGTTEPLWSALNDVAVSATDAEETMRLLEWSADDLTSGLHTLTGAADILTGTAYDTATRVDDVTDVITELGSGSLETTESLNGLSDIVTGMVWAADGATDSMERFAGAMAAIQGQNLSMGGGGGGDVTEMATGGIATTPILFGEAGNEAFIPLHAGPNTLQKMHNDINKDSNITIQLNIDGNSLINEQEITHIIKRISDSVIVERNNRDVRPTQRVYS